AQARDNSEESKQLTSRQSDVTSKEMISGYDQNTIDEIEPQSSVSSNNINLASKLNEKEDKTRTLIPRTDPNKMECLYQYAVEHGLDPEKFSI
ncbi:19986_t:CDS:2, partial [Funneliformis geosporum]